MFTNILTVVIFFLLLLGFRWFFDMVSRGLSKYRVEEEPVNFEEVVQSREFGNE